MVVRKNIMCMLERKDQVDPPHPEMQKNRYIYIYQVQSNIPSPLMLEGRGRCLVSWLLHLAPYLRGVVHLLITQLLPNQLVRDITYERNPSKRTMPI